MVNIVDVRNWIESELYVDALDYVARELNFKVNPQPPSDISLSRDVERFKMANIYPDDLVGVLFDKKFLCRYVGSKLKAIEGTEDVQANKHPSSEPDHIIETLPYYINFLNIHLVELYILKFDSGLLEKYIKLMRIPNSKQYALQLKGVLATMA
ncbi:MULTISPECIES: hypothetical protein [Pseudomonas]|uniref:Uncharacterized protein n=1 Tax=Pseudomonas quercus TaxID=2722792 RepID=A0ABX0YCW8_9PSED|nr:MULTISPECIES: hypothetical protein [Pseudomonas]MBF7142705.1 hypothetical protein [Pseudomonas sp. LY10J]NJP01243.1 hypothetical protein [Pseudomonas quercus]